MNSGHQLLTGFVILIMGILFLNVYSSINTRSDSMMNNEAAITGTAIAQAIINEIKCKAFDQNTVSKAVVKASLLTTSLGRETGEINSTQFNDVDDYNDYSTADTLNRLGVFYINVNVNYINNMLPDEISNSPTFYKQINICVTNFGLPDTLRFYQIISY